MKKILVAIDGSENSKRALIQAKEHAVCTGARVTIITVVKPRVRYAAITYQASSAADLLELADEKILKKALKVFDDFTGQVDTELKQGDPADEIIKEAENGDYDLIIMGSRGLGAFSRSILGSVSNKVLNHVKRNVLIIK